jgi:hypothetical protein
MTSTMQLFNDLIKQFGQVFEKDSTYHPTDSVLNTTLYVFFAIALWLSIEDYEKRQRNRKEQLALERSQREYDCASIN